MRKIMSGAVIGFIVGACVMALAADTYFKGQIIYVNTDQENLRQAPQGLKIGSAVKGTPLIVLQDSEKWVKVTMVGYIWKESVTDNRRALQGKPFRALMIVVRTEQEANDLLQRIRGGLDFAAAAKEHSIDAATAVRGGDLGEFYKGELTPDFEAAILAVQPNQLSKVIKSKVGYHIFKRLQ